MRIIFSHNLIQLGICFCCLQSLQKFSANYFERLHNILLYFQLYSLRTRELITELPLTTDTQRLNPVNTLTQNTSSFASFEDDTESVRTDLRGRGEETPEPVRAFGGYNCPSAILFDFDPRFENSRILLANVHFVQMQQDSGHSLLQHYRRRFSLGEGFFEAQAPCLSLVRLPSWQRIARTRDFGGLPGEYATRWTDGQFVSFMWFLEDQQTSG